MQGTKFISDLITSPAALKAGRINIIEAGVSSGKTTFALTTLPRWAGNPERMLRFFKYLTRSNICLLSEITV